MTTTERAVQIRSDLKSKGISSRQVSIRAKYFSGGSSIDAHIKDASVRMGLVQELVNAHEKISRDQWGEILSGGNTYTHVSYDHDVLKAMAAKFRSVVDAALVVLAESSDSSLIPVAGTYYMVGGRFGRFSLWTMDGHLCECWDAEGLAESIALKEAK